MGALAFLNQCKWIFRTGSSTNIPTLSRGEPFFADNDKLYIGTPSGVPAFINGGAIVDSWPQSPDNKTTPGTKLTKDTLDTKVDKVSGYGLSKNDFSDTEKGAVDNEPGYRNAAIAAADKLYFQMLQTRPVLGGFSWLNQGDATVDDTNIGLHMAIPYSASSFLRILKKAKSGTFTVDAQFLVQFMPGTAVTQFGLALIQSGNTNTISFGIYYSSAGGFKESICLHEPITASPWTYLYQQGSLTLPAMQSVFLRLSVNSSTNLMVFSFSFDGNNWTPIYQMTCADIAWDAIGWFAINPNNGITEHLTLTSWKES